MRRLNNKPNRIIAILESQLKACNRTSDPQTRIERTPSQEKSLAKITKRKYTPFIMLYQSRDEGKVSLL